MAIKLIRCLLVKEPSQRLTTSQVMSDPWFQDMESDPVCQAPSVGTNSSSSCSKSSPTPPSSPPPPAVTSFPQPSPTRGPNRDPVSASKENISPVLHPCSSSSLTSVTLRSKSPSTVNEVHERVIREMITHKKELTKERVERALRLARRPSSSLPAVVESTPLVLEPTTVKLPNVRMDDDDSYITATYNLLKDKILREIHGIPIASNNTHEIKTQHKKGHVLPVRKRGPGVSQAPRFGRPLTGRPLDDLSLKKQLLEEQETSQILAEEEQDFRLPLQRKCSIVSEEGSCELSGRLSETGSDLLSHTILLGDGVEPVIQRRTIPIVDIVITDHDQENGSGDEVAPLVTEDDGHELPVHRESEEIIEDLSEEVDLKTCVEDKFDDEAEDDFDGHCSDQDIGPEPQVRPIIPAIQSSSSPNPAKIRDMLNASNRGERLHVVSSSPDLSKIVDEDLDNDIVLRSDAAAHLTGKRPVTMFIDETTSVKGHVVDDVADHVTRQQNKRRDSRPNDVSGGSSADPGDGKNVVAFSGATAGVADKSTTGPVTMTSVRVITQSKSCNNIIYNGKDRDGENNLSSKGSGRVRGGSSSSGIGSRNRDKDRTDCCLIA